MPPRIPAIKRFLSKIRIDDNGCWNWTASLDTTRYGQLKVNDKLTMAHRFIFEYYHGAICPDLTIDHLCKNKKCVNPFHLEQVSLRVNILRSNNMAAIHARQTHCIHGHEFTTQNTQARSDGGRRCLTCEQIRHKRRYAPHPRVMTN